MEQSAEVQSLTFRNRSGLAGAVQFLLSIWNGFAGGRLRRRIRQFQPDVIHLHNWHFAIGPIAIRAAKKSRVPVVMTMHNYRLLCPSATLSHRGQLFTDSIRASFPWKAVRHKVYRQSGWQTFWLAFVIWFHKRVGTWRQVDRYIALTEFSRSVFADAALNIPLEKWVVKPNFTHPLQDSPEHTPSGGFLYIGRLSEEKGIRVLLEAFRQAEGVLEIGGEGPLLDEVLRAGKDNARITYIGKLDKQQVGRAMMEHEALIFPSTWYEGMPMTILEAFAAGLPVIASELGAMASMIRHGYNGLLFEAGNATDLLDKLHYWTTLTDTQKDGYRSNARATFLENYSPETNREQLLAIYRSVAGN